MQLRTARLCLREATLEDAPFFFELMNSASWIEHIGNRGIKTLADANSYISNNLIESYNTNNYGLYVICLEATPIGLCGLVKRDYLPLPDLGFALLDTHVGQGYVQEAGAAVLDVAFGELKFMKILAITSEGNSASQATLSKLGFEKEGTIVSPEKVELMLYSKIQ